MAGPPVGSDEWKAQDKGPVILAVCWSVTAISTVVVAARLYVRGWMLNKFYSDDYYTTIALICGYISTALSTAAKSYGNGKHWDLLDNEQKQGAILWTTAAFCPGIISFGLPKMAVIALLTRLLNPGKFHRAFLWCMGIWCQLTLFATVGVLLGRCTPARSLWDFSVKGECFDTKILVGYAMYAGSFSAFVDLYLAIYPSIVLYDLRLNMRKKIGLCIALGIGSISGIVAIYKTTRIPSLGSPDFSYDTSDLVIWTVVEGSTIIIACSIPSLQPLLRIMLRSNPFSSDKGSKIRYYEDYGANHKSDIELGQRKLKSKQRDDLGLTIAKDEGSQENILTEDQEESLPAKRGYGTRPPVAKKGITRTDVVTISYEEDSPIKRDPVRSWAGPGP